MNLKSGVMRFASIVFFLFCPVFLFAQQKLRLIGIGADYALTDYWFPASEYDDIVNMTQDASFFSGDDAVDWRGDYGSKQQWSDYRLEAIFQPGEGANLLKVGVQYDAGINKYVYFNHNEHFIIDTVTVSYAQGGNTETVYQDSVAHQSLQYTVHAKNAGIYGEYLFAVNSKNQRFRIYAGAGAYLGFSVSQQVSRSYRRWWVDEYVEEYGFTRYYGQYPQYNPVAGTHTLETAIDGKYAESDANKTFYFSPYVPLSLRIPISSGGFFNHVSFNVTATGGARFGFTKSAGADGKLFYSLRAGLSYLF